MTDDLWTVLDAALGVNVGAPRSRAKAGADASRLTLEAGAKGEKVAVADGRDRFMVRRVKPAPPPEIAYRTIQVEAALCIYEAMLDARMDSTSPTITAAFDAAGSATMRHHAISLVPFVLSVFDLIPSDVRDQHAYDFGIVPAILGTVIFTGAGYVLPPVGAAAHAAIETLDLDG